MSLFSELHSHREEIIAAAAECGVCNVKFFGSVAREEERPNSDVDVLAEIQANDGLMALARFKVYMEERTHRKVDV